LFQSVQNIILYSVSDAVNCTRVWCYRNPHSATRATRIRVDADCQTNDLISSISLTCCYRYLLVCTTLMASPRDKSYCVVTYIFARQIECSLVNWTPTLTRNKRTQKKIYAFFFLVYIKIKVREILKLDIFIGDRIKNLFYTALHIVLWFEFFCVGVTAGACIFKWVRGNR
jgi:hypothetical protein